MLTSPSSSVAVQLVSEFIPLDLFVVFKFDSAYTNVSRDVD